MKINKIAGLGILLILVGVALPLIGVSLPSPIGANVLQFAIVGNQTYDFTTSFSQANSVLIPEHGCWLTFDVMQFQGSASTDDIVHVLVRNSDYQNVPGETVYVYVSGTDQLVASGVTDTNGQIDFNLEAPTVQKMTFTSFAQGHGTISPVGRAEYDVGTMVTFTATPEAGYVVDFWMINGAVHPDCGSRPQITMQMVANYNDKILTVVFRPSDAPPTPKPVSVMEIFNYVTIAGIVLTGGGYALSARKKK